MNKLLLVLTFGLLLVVGATGGAARTYATTGGSILQQNFLYDPANASLLYQINIGGESGCPPELWEMDLQTGQETVIYGCNKNNSKPDFISPDQHDILTGWFWSIYDVFPDLQSLHVIDTNVINLEIKLNRVEAVASEHYWDEIVMRYFYFDIYQNDKYITTLSALGCQEDAHFFAQALGVPGYSKRIVLSLANQSGVGCFEGGYPGNQVSSIFLEQSISSTAIIADAVYQPHLYQAHNYVIYPEGTAVEQKLQQAKLVDKSINFEHAKASADFVAPPPVVVNQNAPNVPTATDDSFQHLGNNQQSNEVEIIQENNRDKVADTSNGVLQVVIISVLLIIYLVLKKLKKVIFK